MTEQLCDINCKTTICRANILPLLSKMCEAILEEEQNLSRILDMLFKIMKDEMSVVRSMVNLYDHKSGNIFIHKSFGLSEEEEARGIYALGEGITGKVVESRKPVIIKKISENSDFLNRTQCHCDPADREMSFMCVPIFKGKKILGSISAERIDDTAEQLHQDLQVLIIFASMIAQAVELYLLENEENAFLMRENKRLLSALKDRFHPSNIIGNSKPMREVYSLIEKISKNRTTVLILGESGVGKELVAEAIHYNSTVDGGPFVKFNCAALPENIIESELFGHEKGSFTGASGQRIGRFEEANGGSIFLDEIGELSLPMQAKLLRVLQEKTFERVGGNKPIKVDIRVIAATNRDLPEMVSAGQFRKDLYYRLFVFPITIPPLKDRENDIVTLVEYFMTRFSAEMGKDVKKISTPAMNILTRYNWPGNVRELENVIERAIIITNDDEIKSYDLPSSMQTSLVPNNGDFKTEIELVECEMLIEALKSSNGNMSVASEKLGMTRRVMGIRLSKFNINYKDFRSQGTEVDSDLDENEKMG
jgi:Nif-specific regulatory protein